MYQRPIRSDELYHFGVKGMHWGVRRYQNEDGSLTDAGKRRYQRQVAKNTAKNLKRKEKAIAKDRNHAYRHRATLSDQELKQRTERLQKENNLKVQYEQSVRYKDTWAKEQIKRAGGTAIAALTAAGIAYVKSGKAKVNMAKLASIPIKMIRR